MNIKHEAQLNAAQTENTNTDINRNTRIGC